MFPPMELMEAEERQRKHELGLELEKRRRRTVSSKRADTLLIGYRV